MEPLEMYKLRPIPFLVTLLAGTISAGSAQSQESPQRAPSKPPSIELFFLAAKGDDATAKPALEQLAANWDNSYAALLLDLLSVLRPPRPSRYDLDLNEMPAGSRPKESLHGSFLNHPRFKIRERLFGFLERMTQKKLGEFPQEWRRWIWGLPYNPHPDYVRFKAELYANIDPAMRDFFPPGARSLIRLDEIEWGGVKVNGIPPLDHPRSISAGAARYLKDDHIVFGIYLNGEARAYPKRILAWHELARDRVGGVELTVVYCTLCGTVIPYESVVGGKLRTLGTSGLLYRSNKLMFDEESKSLWSTLEGKPVVGSLAGSGLRLQALPVVTATWGEWRQEHPETTVLSLDTGYKRDYSEGAAYRSYFATHDLMFSVSKTDSRLKNKDEVLVLRLAPADRPEKVQPVAISAELLARNRIYSAELAGRELVVLTSARGANRAYDSRGLRLRRFLDGDRVEDETGRTWRIAEEALVAENDANLRRQRLPAHRAFWFGWFAQFPETILVK